MSLLSKINGPADLKRLKREQLPQLAQEIRDRLIECVSMTGGHIGASLGVVELSIALLYEFDSPKRPDRVGRRPSGLRVEAPDRPQRSVPDATPARRHLRVPQAHRERARSLRRRPCRNGDVGRARHGHRTRSQGRALQGRGGRGRRGADLRALVRGHEQRGPLGPRHHPHPQRQRDVHLAQRRRDSQDAGPHRRRSAYQPASREDQGDDLRAARGLRRGRRWISRRTSRRASRTSSRPACSSRSSASAISARSTGTISPSSATRSASCAG